MWRPFQRTPIPEIVVVAPPRWWAPKKIVCVNCGKVFYRENIGWDGPQPGTQGTLRCNGCNYQNEIKFEVDNGN